MFSTVTDGTEYTAVKILPDDGWDGKRPIGGLVLSEATLYGVTAEGGFTSYYYPEGYGTVFKINLDGGGFSVLRRFDGYGAKQNGYSPRGGLTLSGTTLYGTTRLGGESGGGTVFGLNTDGTGFKVLKHFGGNDGSAPETRLVLSGSTLYGATVGTVFQLRTDGTDFRVLKRFTSGDGMGLLSDLVQRGETLYGAAARGGNFNHGTVFQLNTDGSGFAVLKHFMGTDGSSPAGAIVLVKNALYGTTSQGGSGERGLVFSLSVPLLLLNPACVGTNFTFSFQSEAGENYTVEYSDDLSAANWLFHHNVTGDGGLISCRIPRTNDAPSFFRLRLP